MMTNSRHRCIWRTSSVAVAAVCIIGSYGRADPLTLIPRSARTLAPDFALSDADGARVALSGLNGHVVLLDFWATWCTGCKVEIPWYMGFQRKYAKDGLASIGVAMDDEGWAKVRPYLAEHPISYPVVIGNLELLQHTFNLAPSLPVTLLIDRDGKVAESHVGMVHKTSFERDIRRLLQEKPHKTRSHS
jgi:cytochrome c biogenesis protein CcmG/thiol:disulfide interchange protein DsbE